LVGVGLGGGHADGPRGPVPGASCRRNRPTASRWTGGQIRPVFCRAAPKDDPRLAVRALGLSFPNPVGVAAGFDKNARAFRAMLRWASGTWNAERSRRARRRAIRARGFTASARTAPSINRMGFDNDGMERGGRTPGAPPQRHRRINIGANKDSARPHRRLPHVFARLSPHANFVAVNVSSRTRRAYAACRTASNCMRCWRRWSRRAPAKRCRCCSRSRPISRSARWTTSPAEVLAAGIEG